MTNRITLFGGTLLSILIGVNFYLYAPEWSGDPEIHMAFAQNLLRSAPFQFNPGELSGGETSPVYMLVAACCIAVLGLLNTPIAMKALGALSALLITWQIYRHHRAQHLEKEHAAVAALGFLAYPFVAMQSLLGMENMLFTAAVVYFTSRIIEDRLTPRGWRGHFTIGAAMAALFFLRPEAVFLILSAALAALVQHRPRNLIPPILAVTLILVILGMMWAASVPMYTAGEARIISSRWTSRPIHLFGIDLFLSRKPLRLLLYLWPYLLMSLYLFGREGMAHCQIRKPACWLFIGLVVIPLAAHALYLLPNTHFSRYTVYVVAAVVLLVPPTIPSRYRNIVSIMVVVAALCAAVAENHARYKMKGDAFPSTDAFRAKIAELSPAKRARLSNALCRELHCRADQPVSLGLQGVQLRLRLDHRFVIRSLDGVVDREMAPFMFPEGPDYIGYIRKRHIDYLLALPEYRPHPTHDALAALASLDIGDKRTINGMTFEMIFSEVLNQPIIRVGHTPPSAYPLNEHSLPESGRSLEGARTSDVPAISIFQLENCRGNRRRSLAGLTRLVRLINDKTPDAIQALTLL